MLSDSQLLRYSRQIMLPQLDVAGQEKLLSASVLVVGLGGLGSPVAMYLAAAGIGRLMLADFDQVDHTNLQRQIVHCEESVGELKTASAEKRLRSLNADIKIETYAVSVDGELLKKLMSNVDVVVDCSDNFSTRFLLNQFCVAYSVPLVSGAAIRTEGQLAVYDAREVDSPCYQCLYANLGEESLGCSEAGVLSPIVGVIGAMQSVEAIKVLTGMGRSSVGYLMLYDGLTMDWRKLRIKKDPSCEVCSGG